MNRFLARRLVAEFLGTLFLLAAVVGSGIMAERLSQGNVALALLANAVATGAALVALILAFGPVSGAHFNPAVTLVQAVRGEKSWLDSCWYIFVQLFGAYAGVLAAHVMFALPAFSVSTHARSGGSQMFSEFLATVGLLLVIVGCDRLRPSAAPFAVGAYITAAYWFTASTSFANPAVTLARCVTDTFAGIRPADVPGFLLAQLLAVGACAMLLPWLFARPSSESANPQQEIRAVRELV